MAITFIITNAGRNALVNAANTGTAPVTIAQAGLSGSAVTPTPAAAALPGEFKRITTLSGDVVADDTIHLIVRDESSDVFTLRSIALYLADGTLFGIYGQAEPMLEKSAQALMLLAIDIRFEDVSAANIAFGNANFLNPPATTERQGVIELATVAEAKAGGDAVRAVTPSAAKQAVVDWIGYSPVNLAGDSMTGPLAIQLAGSATLSLNSLGVAIGRLTMQSDGNLVLYRNAGAGDAAIFGVSGQNGPFAVHVPITRQGHQVWDAGNDGAGSGLDADLLDGQDGGYYTNIVARLGYMPINKGGDNVTASIHFQNSDSQPIASRPATTVPLHVKGVNSAPAIISFERSGIHAGFFGLDTDNRWKVGGWSMGAASHLLWHAGNDGAGSGLDADLLDGQDGGYYANIVGRLGYTPANKAGDIFTGSIARDPGYYLDLMGSSPLVNFDVNDYLLFDRSINRLSVVIGGTARAGFAADGWLSVQSGVLINGIAAWHAGNDGSGSGLDADLLDGQDSSFYTDIPSRLGYSPVSKGGDIMSGPLDIVYPGAALTLNSSGVAVGRLAMQSDGALVLYRDDGSGGMPIFSIPSQTDPFNVHRTITRQGNLVWDAANDGSGSGMDADYLDGQDGSFYANIPARLGYTPINKGGDRFTGGFGRDGSFYFDLMSGNPLLNLDDNDYLLFDRAINTLSIVIGGLSRASFSASGVVIAGGLAWHSANDGSGSGLDADLLDGQDGSFYTDIPSRLGYAPVSKGGDTMSGPLDIVYPGAALTLNSSGVAVGRLVMQSDGALVLYRDDGSGGKPIFSIPSQTDPFNVHRTITREGNLVWDAANDGSGSGMDADFLDGQDGSFYTDIPSRLGYAPVSKGGDTMSGPLDIVYPGAALTLNSSGVAIGRLAMQGDGALVLYRDDGAGPKPIFSIPSQTDPFNVQRTITRQGYLVWDAANDGSGSGMDADLLDGQDGGYYTDIVARLGYAPINKGGDNVTAPIHFQNGDSQPIASRLDAAVPLHVKGVSSAPALISFERSGIYAGYFGLDTDNRWKVGGWSMGAASYELWHAGSDGSGSGLDADLLDGQDGSFYTDIPSRLGYAPVSKGGDTMSGPLDIVYPGATLTLNSSGVAVGRLAMQSDGSLVLYRDDGAGSKAIFSIPSQTDPFNVHRTIARQGNLVWDAGNDGSGSGLDADLLDGLDASAFARMADFGNSLGDHGFQRLPNGLILQWGSVVAPAGGINNVTFPVAFPNQCLAAFATNQSAGVPAAWAGAGNISKTGMTVGHASSSLNASAAGTAAFWYAIGR